MSDNQSAEDKQPTVDPEIAKLQDHIDNLQKEYDEAKKSHAEEKEHLMQELEKQAKAYAEEKEKLHLEMKKIAESKGVKININPKGCYSDSKTRRAKLAEEQAKKSKSKKE